MLHEMQHASLEKVFDNNYLPFNKTNSTESANKMMSAIILDNEQLAHPSLRTQMENRICEIIDFYLKYPLDTQPIEIPTFLSEASLTDHKLTEELAPNLCKFIRETHPDIHLNIWRAPVSGMLNKLLNIKQPLSPHHLIKINSFIDNLMKDLNTRGLTDVLFDNKLAHRTSMQYRADLSNAIREQQWLLNDWIFKDHYIDIIKITKQIADSFEQSQKSPPAPHAEKTLPMARVRLFTPLKIVELPPVESSLVDNIEPHKP